MPFLLFLNGKAQGSDTSGAQRNYSVSGDIVTLYFVPDAADSIQVVYWYDVP
jgi:hypothetical protein